MDKITEQFNGLRTTLDKYREGDGYITNSLRLQVIAEGVETCAQFEALNCAQLRLRP